MIAREASARWRRPLNRMPTRWSTAGSRSSTVPACTTARCTVRTAGTSIVSTSAVLAIVGDSPDALVILTNWRIPGGGGCSAAKLGHLFLGLRDAQGGKWFSNFQTIKARYVPGHQDFELQDPSVHGTIHLSYVRPVDFEGLLVRVRLPEGLKASSLVLACGGATDWSGGHLDYQGGKGSREGLPSRAVSGERRQAVGARICSPSPIPRPRPDALRSRECPVATLDRRRFGHDQESWRTTGLQAEVPAHGRRDV